LGFSLEANVRSRLLLAIGSAILVSACSGSLSSTPPSLAGSSSSFSLAPSEIDLTPGVFDFDREHRR